MMRRTSFLAIAVVFLSLSLGFGSAVQAASSNRMQGSGRADMQNCSGGGVCTCATCTCTTCTCANRADTTGLTRTGTLNTSLSPAMLALINKMPRMRTVLQSLLVIAAPQTLLAGEGDVTAATCTCGCSGARSGSGSCTMSGSGSCGMNSSGTCSMIGSGSCSMGGSVSCSKK